MKNILFALLFMVFSTLSAQVSRWSVSGSLADQRYAFSTREDGSNEPLLRSKIRPSFAVGFERNWSAKDKKNRWFQGIEIQGFHYKYLDLGASFLTELGYERRFFNKLLIGLRIGGGFQLAFKDDRYQIYENNEWVTKKDFGPMIYRNLLQGRANIGWRVNDKLDAVIGYRYQITTPYYKPAEIDLMLAKGIEFGIRYRLER